LCGSNGLFTKKREISNRHGCFERLNVSGGDPGVYEGVPPSRRCDQKDREYSESQSSGKKDPGHEFRNDLAQGYTPEDHAREKRESDRSHGDGFLDHNPGLISMGETLLCVGIDLVILLSQNSLELLRKPQQIPGMRCAEEKQKATEREKELEALSREKLADEVREPLNL